MLHGHKQVDRGLLSLCSGSIERETVRILGTQLFVSSMGALLAFEIAKYLESEYHINPTHLFVSGSYHPTLSSSPSYLSDLSDVRFLEAIKKMGGIPEAVLNDEGMMRFFLPLFRADFALIDNYRKSLLGVDPFQVSKVTCPITAFNGDKDVRQERMQGWETFTKSTFTLHGLRGGHFYLLDKDNEKTIAKEISKVLCEDASSSL
ncbi:gramicidin S biosynthesis protein GrsT-like isoform X2 [Corticium candelabrum]|uniref:gramicidin S biosynthesis protein GrsT-like isoform X2 n=1 Tax=Corticium candelabrum TaxID=121492 RepID=UPI002E259F6A|nr:gramicidin S biosynthesis protein GrsT-like isoform X2 [Corticium candelabrum]